MSEIATTAIANPKSKFKVQLLDGTYEGVMSGYTVTIQEGPITTQFSTNTGIRGTSSCKVTIKEGFAEVKL